MDAPIGEPGSNDLHELVGEHRDEQMSYDAETGTVIYRSKMHLGLKRNFHLARDSMAHSRHTEAHKAGKHGNNPKQ